MAVSKWKHYLIGYHFIIKIDHYSLKFLMEQKLNTTLQQKRLTKLLGYDYEIQFKKGIDNGVPDGLSRWVEATKEDFLCEITYVQPQWLLEVIQSYEGDEDFQKLIAAQLIHSGNSIDYSYEGGILKYKGKIMIGDMGGVRNKILHNLHNSAIRGYSS
ncbi:hypothetical protein ACH5RR_026381 [Cinchona calisaya]|uniref:Reverse transcriptase RNase H-like domain-containing protein n=1 Tax=Cinchona calisaya TaxID=153742 RepID=A0ABD2Z3J0_9GENT